MRRKTLFVLFLLLAAAPVFGDTEPVPDSGRTPRIDRIVPDTIDACSLQEGRTLAVLGDFPAGTRILFDGAGVSAEKTGAGEIVLNVPVLKGGLHRVEAVSPGDRRSIPQALVIDTVPQITGVTTGEDRVTAYEVIVSGVNFLFESALVVNGAALRATRAEDPNTAPPPAGGRDYVRYRDCSTLVYVRHPVTREPQTVTLRVVNPGGEQSPGYEVNLP